MIEVNLSPVQVRQDYTKVGPINLSLINPIYFSVAIIAMYMVEGLIDGYFNDDIKTLETEYRTQSNELKKLRDELREYDNVKKQVQELNDKSKELQSKIGIIKKIVDKRQNPFYVLKYIAEKTPDEIWINELEITDENVRIVGYSKSFFGISKFQEELRQSIHFNGSVQYNKPQTLESEYKGIRVEAFELSTTVSNWYGE